MCFRDASSSPPGRPLGAQSDRKGAKMEPKVTKKVVRRHRVERAKSMAGMVREAHGEVPGRVREPLFSGTRCEGLSVGLPRRVRDDLL
jgi:hypothetical protein